MSSFLQTVLYKRTPEEIELMCKNPGPPVKMTILRINGKMEAAHIYDSITVNKSYSWKQGSRTPFKEWYAKTCPKVNHDYTVRDLIRDIFGNPLFHTALVVAWVALNAYIYYYKEEEDENMLAFAAVVGSLFLHFFLYRDLQLFSYGFSRVRLIPAVLLLLSPIIAPLAIIALNWTDVPEKATYKEYLWWSYAGSAALYTVLGLLGNYIYWFI